MMELLDFVPIFFYELYTIHRFRNGHFVPLVFALLSGKSDRVYRNIWNSLKAACTERNYNLQPKLIHVDFQLTMHTVLNDVFPVASLNCCRLHLGQAWYCKILVWIKTTRIVTVKSVNCLNNLSDYISLILMKLKIVW